MLNNRKKLAKRPSVLHLLKLKLGYKMKRSKK